MRKVLTTLSLTTLLLVCADSIFRVLAQNFIAEPPTFFLNFMPSAGLMKFWELTGQGIQPVTFTGSSMIEYALSPNHFRKETAQLFGKPVEAANVGIAAATVRFNYLLIRDVIAPTGTRTVIYGVELRAFSPDDPHLNETPMGYALTQIDEPFRSADLWLLQHSAIFQYRDNVRQLLQGQREILKENWGPVDDPGWVTYSGAPDDIRSLSFLTAMTDEQLATLTMNKLAVFCKHQALTCIIVNMPVQTVVNTHTSTSQMLRYKSILKQLIDNGLEVWDFNTVECLGVFDGGFVDLNHLNEAGALKFTRIAAEMYYHFTTGVALPKGSLATCVRSNQDVYSFEF